MKRILLSFFVLSEILVSAQSTVSSYPTLTANNGSGGVTFEVVTTAPIDIISFTTAAYTGTPVIQIWYRPGGVLHPSATTPSIMTTNGWILHEQQAIANASTTIPVSITLVTPLNLPPGTYGFAVGNSSTTARYMTYSASFASTFTDGTLTINTGVGKGWGGTFPNPTIATRSFVGSLTYTPVSSVENDAGVTSIDSPAGGCEGLYNVVVTVKNFGVNQVDTVIVNWSHNSILQTPDTLYALLDTFNGLGSQKAQITLGSLNLVGGQMDTIRAWTTMPNNKVDSVTDNDSAMTFFNSLSTITSFPYYEDFESGQGEWFSGGSNSSWAYGNPAKATITGAASGLNAFVTGGLSTGQYNINENSWVASPCFDLSGFEGTAWVAADIWWNAEFSFDGAVLQSSVDGGKSWQNVGSYQDPNKWYNDNTITGNPGGQQTGWSGRASTSNGSGGWVMAKNTLNVALSGGPVRFRIAFGSEGSINDDGFAFDNFRIVDFQKVNLGPDVVSLCGNPNYTLDPGIDTINGRIWWSTLDSVNRSISVTNPDTIWVKYTDDMINETDYDTIIIVQSTPPAIGFVKAVDTININQQITLDPHLPFNLNFNWTPGGYTFPFLLVKGSEVGLGTHTFNLLVSDSLYCEDYDTMTVVVTLDYTGIGEITSSEFSVYPNPVSDKLNVILNNQDGGISEVSLFDLQGKRVYNGLFDVSEQAVFAVDLSNMPSGTYVLHVRSGERDFREQIIKLK